MPRGCCQGKATRGALSMLRLKSSIRPLCFYLDFFFAKCENSGFESICKEFLAMSRREKIHIGKTLMHDYTCHNDNLSMQKILQAYSTYCGLFEPNDVTGLITIMTNQPTNSSYPCQLARARFFRIHNSTHLQKNMFYGKSLRFILAQQERYTSSR